MRIALCSAALLAAGIMAAQAQDVPAPVAKPAAPTTAQDPNAAPAAVKAVDPASFVAQALAANAFEIDSSRLAELNGDDAAVKAFARRMIADHTEAAQTLASLAAPAAQGTEATGSVGDPMKAKVDELAGLSGEKFDRAYLEAQRSAHEDAIRLFTAYAESGDDPKLRDFAVSTLPKLQEHQAALSKITK